MQGYGQERQFQPQRGERSALPVEHRTVGVIHLSQYQRLPRFNLSKNLAVTIKDDL